jgi:O-antigen ligase
VSTAPVPRRSSHRAPDAAWAPAVPVVIWALCLFAASIPLEAPDRFIIEVSAMTSALLVLSTVVDLRGCYARLPLAVVCFAFYLVVLAVSFALQGGMYPGGVDLLQVAIQFLRLITNVLLLWACANLLRTERIYRAGLWFLVLGCLIRAALPILGLARSGTERVAAFGQNPNESAQVLAMGLLALVGLNYVQPRGARWLRVLAWSGCALLAVGLVQTGSRGGLATACIGGVIYLATGQTLRIKIRNVAIGLLMLSGLAFLTSRSDTMRARLEKTFAAGDPYETGSLNLAGRETIWPLALDMIRDKPLLGWGPLINRKELGLRLGDPEHGTRDTHNLPLEVLTSSGLLGAIPFFLGTWLCLRAAWRFRAGPRGAVPLALVVAILAGNLSQNRISGPVLWFILAYGLASEATTPACISPVNAVPGSRSGAQRTLRSSTAGSA